MRLNVGIVIVVILFFFLTLCIDAVVVFIDVYFFMKDVLILDSG